MRAGEIQIYFSILPETVEEEFAKPRNRKKWMEKIRDTMNYAESFLECPGEEQILFSERLCRLFDRNQKLPTELYGAFLWEIRKRNPFSSLVLSLPQEYSMVQAEDIKTLLWPYLPRLNGMAFTGGETRVTQELEDFFYEEYGIVTEYGSGKKTDIPHLNFCSQGEMLKFLDTVVKSGYNTDVD